MSWKTINAILALAVVDEKFCESLLQNPVQTIQLKNFELTQVEREKIRHITAHDLTEFSQKILTVFSKES
ncbi:hypothetical protein ccbrp13_66600 [Ktedonobacteria bacterium brp13]|nr:hypothetical protein ccbrp13_66600 [Ktedonobacteria bacterium brp13]